MFAAVLESSAEPLTICKGRPTLGIPRLYSRADPGRGLMPAIDLKVEELILDHDNPRITHAEGQQEALQKIVTNQKTKLVKLAQSIADHGLNPMDRLLVLRVHQRPERFIALEGNRR